MVVPGGRAQGCRKKIPHIVKNGAHKVWVLAGAKGQKISRASGRHSAGVERCPCSCKGAENGKELRRHVLAQTVVSGESQPSLRLLNDLSSTRASSRSQTLSCFGLKSVLRRASPSWLAAARHVLKQLLDFFGQGPVP